jgi:hypothetical protein
LETIAAAALVVMIVLPAQWLYGRFSRLAALVVVVPILWDLSPWNSIYHDFHWSKLDWALAFYEPTIVVLLILWFAQGSNNQLERLRDWLPQSRR